MPRTDNRDEEAAPDLLQIRHRAVPARQLSDRIIVARPADGTPIVLAPTAATVWNALENWVTVEEIDNHLDKEFPDVPFLDRRSARQQVLITLKEEGLVEQR